jgi:eukaryotic-like serine/threonine-protein kinase
MSDRAAASSGRDDTPAIRADETNDPAIGRVIGSYQILRKLGEGGMGAVYLAQHTLLGRRAALKMLLPEVSARPDVVNRFFNEARSTTSINDPGIVQVFDFGFASDGHAYFVMEYLEGEPLDARLQRLGSMAVRDALRLTRQVATSLAAAHASGIVHRDLKPENIYLVRDAEVASGERPKILDFGIAKLSDDQAGKLKTRTGTVMGTPRYMSPEQCRGTGEIDHRSDIYALGCVLFHLVAGAPPFDGEGAGELIGAHLHVPAPLLSSRASGIAPSVDALLSQCLAKRPEDRFQSMQELIAAIGRALVPPTSPGAPPHDVSARAASSSDLVGGEGLASVGAPASVAVTTLRLGAGQVSRAARPTRLVLPLLAVVVLGGGVFGAVAALGGRGDAETRASTSSDQGAVSPEAPAEAAPVTAAVTAPVTAPVLPDAAPAVPASTLPDAAPAPADAEMAVVDEAVELLPNPAVSPQPPKRSPAARASSARAAPPASSAPPARAAPPARPASPAPAASSGGANASGCDRRVDLDCDGIPDVR